VPASKPEPGSGPTGSPGQGLNDLTIRRQGSRALTPAQEQAYLLLCACADRLRNHDLAAVDVMHAQACTMDTLHDGVPVVVSAPAGSPQPCGPSRSATPCPRPC
jgi:hypothetical protein